jgi:hypothetical protein
MPDKSHDSSESAKRSSRFNHFDTGQVLGPLILLVLLFAVVLVALTYVFKRFQVDGAFLPENNLPVMLIAATVSLLLAVATIVIIFGRLNLTSYRAALGLPAGSVRAIIALLLILLFFITAVFLYADVGRDGSDRALVGISQTRFDAIPTADIRSATARDVEGETVWDVSLANPKNEASRDLAKQLVTTVSTLVVAVASFYFGANSVQQAANGSRSTRATSEDTPPPPTPIAASEIVAARSEPLETRDPEPPPG